MKFDNLRSSSERRCGGSARGSLPPFVVLCHSRLSTLLYPACFSPSPPPPPLRLSRFLSLSILAKDTDSVPKSISISSCQSLQDVLTAAYQFRVVPPLLLNRSGFIIYFAHFVRKRFSEGEAASNKRGYFYMYGRVRKIGL